MLTSSVVKAPVHSVEEDDERSSVLVEFLLGTDGKLSNKWGVILRDEPLDVLHSGVTLKKEISNH